MSISEPRGPVAAGPGSGSGALPEDLAGARRAVERAFRALARVWRLAMCPRPWPQLVVSAFGVFIAPGVLFPASGLYEVREVSPQVFVWVPEDVLDLDGDPEFKRTATAGFIVTSEGVVTVDTTNNPSHARELLYEIRRRTDLPVRYVINTVSRADHMLGNQVFADQQAVIVSTSEALAAIRRYQEELLYRLEADWRLPLRMRGIQLRLPTQTFEGEMRLRVSEREIELLSAGLGPLTGDLMVYLRDAKVLFLGDLYQNGYFPRIDSRDLRRWIEVLQKVEGWDVVTYIPGHGEPGGKAELAAFRQFLAWLSNEVESRVKEGKSLKQVKGELGALGNYRWRARELATGAVEAAYQQFANEVVSGQQR